MKAKKVTEWRCSSCGDQYAAKEEAEECCGGDVDDTEDSEDDDDEDVEDEDDDE